MLMEDSRLLLSIGSNNMPCGVLVCQNRFQNRIKRLNGIPIYRTQLLVSFHSVWRRFGSTIVPGRWISGDDVMCTAPAHKAASVALEISSSTEMSFTNDQVCLRAGM